MVGLCGTYEQVKATCKAYRVYFSTPPNVKPGDDYIVDHSIYFYLMDPEGQFVDAFGKDRTAEEVVERFDEAVEHFEKEYLIAQINRFGGNISRTAEFIGMERSALHRKLKSLGV